MAYTDSELIKACKNNITFKGVVLALGGSNGGWWQNRIKEGIHRLGIDISHFDQKKAQRENAKRVGRLNIVPWQEALVRRTTGARRCSRYLRSKLDEAGVPYTCSKCPVTGMWNGQKVRLEVNHKNGNPLDDRKENLEYLCPNCHSQDEHSPHKA